MKSFILSGKFIFLCFLSIQLSICSNDDNDNEIQEEFVPITISLEGLDVKIEETSFVVDGYQFTSSRVISNNVGDNDGLLLAFPQDGEGSKLELDLSSIRGFSKITLSIFNNAGGTAVSLWNNENLVIENDNIPNAEVGNLFKDTTIILDNEEIDLLRITSFEAVIKSIKLE